jgi:hypothetical protein
MGSGFAPQPGVARSGRGQALTVLPAWVEVTPGWRMELAAERGPGGITFAVGDITPPPPLPLPPGPKPQAPQEPSLAASGGRSARVRGACSSSTAAEAGAPAQQGLHHAAAAAASGARVFDAPRAPWFSQSAGMGDPDVWAVRRCEAVLAEALARAPAMRHPPLWRDVQMLQVRGRSCWWKRERVGNGRRRLHL